MVKQMLLDLGDLIIGIGEIAAEGVGILVEGWKSAVRSQPTYQDKMREFKAEETRKSKAVLYWNEQYKKSKGE